MGFEDDDDDESDEEFGVLSFSLQDDVVFFTKGPSNPSPPPTDLSIPLNPSLGQIIKQVVCKNNRRRNPSI